MYFQKYVLKTGHCVNVYSPVFLAILEKVFAAAVAGKDPGRYDNSKYLLVDPRYAGQIITGTLSEIDPKFLTGACGERIAVLGVDTPLAWAKWGVPEPEYSDCTEPDVRHNW